MKEKKRRKEKKKGKKRQEKGNGKSFDHATKNRLKQVCGLNSCRSKEKKHTTKRKIRKRWW